MPPYNYKILSTFNSTFNIHWVIRLTNPSPEKSIGPRWTLGMRAIGIQIEFKHLFPPLKFN